MVRNWPRAWRAAGMLLAFELDQSFEPDQFVVRRIVLNGTCNFQALLAHG